MCKPPSLRLHSTSRAQYRSRRSHNILLTAATVLELIVIDEDDDEQVHLCGRLLGTKNIERTRQTVDDMFSQLGSYAKQAWKSDLQQFNAMHDTLQPYLEEQFPVVERSRGVTQNGEVSTKLRLSAAIRYFCGAAVYDLMLTHGLGRQTIYNSIYGVANAVNKCPGMDFNASGASFPSHEEQREIAEGFRMKSAADFDKIVLTVDGMLVWTTQPSKQDCGDLKIGVRSFHCFRKDKFGVLLMAGCDHKCRFRWADVKHPGITSDYTAWVTSKLGIDLQNPDQDIILADHTIVGDGAFIETDYMAIPIPGKSLPQYQDAYNFYLSQVRITIERAFGILVHRFGMLRSPISLSIKKVPAIVMCLMRLHNYYIDHCGRKCRTPYEEDERRIQYRAWRNNAAAVRLNKDRCPEDLLGSGSFSSLSSKDCS
jgi:hypothetical protein